MAARMARLRAARARAAVRPQEARLRLQALLQKPAEEKNAAIRAKAYESRKSRSITCSVCKKADSALSAMALYQAGSGTSATCSAECDESKHVAGLLFEATCIVCGGKPVKPFLFRVVSVKELLYRYMLVCSLKCYRECDRKTRMEKFSDELTRSCAACRKETSLKHVKYCPECGIKCYCGEKCVLAHRAAHKAECNEIRSRLPVEPAAGSPRVEAKQVLPQAAPAAEAKNVDCAACGRTRIPNVYVLQGRHLSMLLCSMTCLLKTDCRCDICGEKGTPQFFHGTTYGTVYGATYRAVYRVAAACSLSCYRLHDRRVRREAGAATLTRRCAQCSAAGALKDYGRCSKCKAAYYCGVDCQRKHFKLHKLGCGNAPSPYALWQTGGHAAAVIAAAERTVGGLDEVD